MMSSSEEKILMTKQVIKLYKLKATQGICDDFEVKKTEETKDTLNKTEEEDVDFF